MSAARDRCEDFRISRRPGCARSLNWIFDWRGALVAAGALEVAMARAGFVSVPSVAGVSHQHSEDGDVLVVHRNLRIELRVPYTVALSDRPKAVIRLARTVAAALRTAERRESP